MRRIGESLAAPAAVTGLLLAGACSAEQPAPPPSSITAPKDPNTTGPFPFNCTSSLGGLALTDQASKRFRMTLLATTHECGDNYLPPLHAIAYDRTFMSRGEHDVEILPMGSEMEVTCIGTNPPVLGIKADAPAVVRYYGPVVPNQVEQAVGPMPDCVLTP